jgi:uncharacterized membrane protein/nitrite reductase/ring-hydroxylating ferredoxin subunit
MKSTAHFKSHPIHPILVSFPIAFFIGTVIFDILALIYDETTYETTAKYLSIAGIVGAFAAAVPGIIDYTFTVPPNSSAKKRATQHGILNVSVTLLFAVGLYLRLQDDVSRFILLALEIIAISLMTLAGWMGGTLVYRNQIGVDVRYADAGKWSELRIERKEGLLEVAKSHEIKLNQMKLIRVGEQRIVLSRTEKGIVVFDDRCTHKGASLAGGSMMCGTVQCPWHGSQFDVHSGAVKAGPAKQVIKTVEVSEESGKVYVKI